MNPLVKALEDLSIEENRQHMISIAKNALSLYSQSMNTEDHARDYYMNDDGQSKPEPVVQDNEMWHPNYYPQSKEGEDFQQDLKEFDACFDHLYKMQGVKDAGHSWIEFTDKWNAFKKKLSSKENEGKQAGFTDAIDFAEWIRENEYESHGNRWVEPWHTNQKLYDTQQLYNLFRGQPIVESGERGEVERLKGFLRDIDLITDYADFDEVAKYKMIQEVINSYNKTIKP